MDKNFIIRTLDEIATMLELKDENPFKVRAYKNAARALETSDLAIDRNISAKELLKIRGIGRSLADHIITLACNNKLDFYEELKESITPSLLEMLKIPTLGPKKIKFLYDNLNIGSISDLEKAVSEDKLINLPNFGLKTQENIIRGIESFKKFKKFYLYSDVIFEAQSIINKIRLHKKIIRADIAGSLRRKKEIVRDIDIVAGIKDDSDSQEIMDYFTSLEEVDEIIAKGDTKSSIRLGSGINADLRVVKDSQYPYLLHHFTGSKEHNIVLRGIAQESGFKINEYGIFKGEELVRCSDEHEFYKVFSMDFIEPELRENIGEFEAASDGKLPDLIDEKDLKGIFHIHTIFSDGNITLKALSEKLSSEGFEYAGISDHSKSAYYAGGVKPENIDNYLNQIIDFCSLEGKIKIFKGIESDIMADGNLDYCDAILEKFDFVIAAVHSGFNLSGEEMTNRIIKALENKYTTILAHPTGRLLLTREPYKVDMIKIINAAAINNVAIEINSNPYRLDLDWRLCKYAKEKNVKIFICPDAHKLEDIDNYEYGINIARKGWLEKKDIINTFDKKNVEIYLKNLKNLKKTR
ncbi:MAG: DNA polymerase/3'-5' exonuclease PolX [Actinobacteria bacterium]|nr:DNA polymerase/3'-5' exonuclease PolX [Actinomycetota bacterium]